MCLFYLKHLKPLDSPEVVFVGTAPIHEHIYSNGYICLSILYTGKIIIMYNLNLLEWSPALRVSSVVISIQSMMSSAKKKVKPVEDESVSKQKVSPKLMSWMFDDDKA